MPCTGRFTSGASLAGFAPVKAVVDMTSTVKRHGDAGIGRAAAAVGLVPDFVDAGVASETARHELGGGIPR